MAFTAKDVQNLRELTGVGMMDCKKALTETGGDIDGAIAYLREKGMAAAAKKAGRIAAEGAVFATVDPQGGCGAIIEINCETDFAAKSEDFQAFLQGVAATVLQARPAGLSELAAAPFDGGTLSVEETLRERVLKIGENLQIRRFERFTDSVNVAYVHMGGKIGVLVNLKAPDGLGDDPRVLRLGRDLAMQAAAMRPEWLRSDEVDAKSLEGERAILMSQAMAEGKPQAVAEKIVAGRINKFFAEKCLLSQVFVKDNKLSVAQYVDTVAKDIGGEIEVTRFVRYEKGEGIAKREDDFADEVAKMTK
ncbi:MAG: translation elongation factor Ts [Oscillospiraceae bacterium]|nr:translation elongation factor Ts [Oscillospiraceae bacterium]